MLTNCPNCVEESSAPPRWTMPLLKLGEKRYYLSIFFKANWFKALQYCRFHGMQLASIQTQEENDRLEKYVKDYGLATEHFWTSGTDLAEEGSFFWVSNGRPLSFTNWNAGEPNNFRYENGEEEHCLELWNRDGKGLKWNDTPCSFETMKIFLFAILIASLAVAHSKDFGPKSVDEVLQQNRCLCPCKPFERKEYFIPLSRTSDWFGAVAFCHSIGMEIAEVLNEAEATALGEVIAEEESDSDPEFYWIGANDLGVQGTYRWSLSGRPVKYSRWAAGEPNNARGEDGQQPAERCAAVALDKLEWNDFRCTQQKRFICQQFRDE
uniref:C-type lectin domain-containing protein n=1 Tax=Anopheles epiroticus TaxID=199890 RepID=A0A182PGF1_9DIPT